MPRILRRKHRKSFDRRVRRRREIERHAIHVGAADTDDFDRWLIAWSWHNTSSKKPVEALIGAADRMGRHDFDQADAEGILEEASITRRHMSADNLACFLGVNYAQREALGLTTIGSIDVRKNARAILRKRKKRLARERKRREQGVRPRAEYLANALSTTKPWDAEGISRRTWERRRRKAATIDASPRPPDSLSTGDTLATGATREAAAERRMTAAPVPTAARAALRAAVPAAAGTLAVRVAASVYGALPLELRLLALGLPAGACGVEWRAAA